MTTLIVVGIKTEVESVRMANSKLTVRQACESYQVEGYRGAIFLITDNGSNILMRNRGMREAINRASLDNTIIYL